VSSAVPLRSGEFWANCDVNFTVDRGECVGLIGRNGAGKTTLLKMLGGLIKPDSGRIEMSGRTGALIALGAGFNPILTGRENVYVNASILGYSKREIDNNFDRMIEFAEIGDAIDAPVRTYSSGMQVRLGFAIAAFLEPDVLLVDEVLAVGDAAFRRKCYQFFDRLIAGGSSVVIVSHALAQISTICDRAIVLEGGRIEFDGRAGEGVNHLLNRFESELQPCSVPVSNGLDSRDSPLRISEIEIFGTREAAPVICGQTVHIRIRFRCATSLSGLVTTVSFWLADGTTLLASCRSAAEDFQFDAGCGDGFVQLTMGACHLAPGTYVLKASIGASGSPTPYDEVGYESPARTFRVASDRSSSDDPIPRIQSPAVVFPASWSASTRERMDTRETLQSQSE
jgi:lipopolysaccharide transport system ATP-binding protein